MKTYDLVEHFIRMLVEQGADPKEILSGVHNAFVHGEILEEAGYNVSDKQLSKLFAGFESSIAAAKRMAG